MLSIQLPHIAVQKVTNGYVVQWQKKNPDEKSANRSVNMTAVCLDKASLLDVIDNAASDVGEIGG